MQPCAILRCLELVLEVQGRRTGREIAGGEETLVAAPNLQQSEWRDSAETGGHRVRVEVEASRKVFGEATDEGKANVNDCEAGPRVDRTYTLYLARDDVGRTPSLFRAQEQGAKLAAVYSRTVFSVATAWKLQALKVTDDNSAE